MLSYFNLLLLAAALPQVLCSAIPAEEARDESGIPQEFIDQVMASFTTNEHGHIVAKAELHKSSLLSRSLEKRAQPSDQGCGRNTWTARYCMSDIGPREWHDRCLQPNGAPTWVGGICPEFTYCSEELDGDGDDVIVCTPSTPPREDNTGSTARGRRQYGFRTIQPIANVASSQRLSSILLQLGINSGSVSGHLRSMDRKFVIAPQNTLTANLRGKVLNLCRSSTNQSLSGFFKNSRTCGPTTHHNFVNGDTVDFSYGLSPTQEGILFYNISP